MDPYSLPIEPYTETLSGAPIGRKREWADTVYDQLREKGLLVAGNRLVFHAGRDYYEELLPHLDDTPVETEAPTDSLEYEAPTDSLEYGKTLAWYNDRL